MLKSTSQLAWYNFNYVIILFLLSLITLILGCQATTPITQLLPNTPTLAITPTLLPPTTTPSPTPTPEAVKTLTLWTVEEVSAQAEGDTGNLFRAILRNFEYQYKDVKVDIILKKPSGKGGMLDFLRTAKEVAPTTLPDIAIINAVDLEQAHLNGSIVPLDGRLDRAIAQDLLPAARKIGTIDGQLLGVPLGLEMQHLIYNTKTLTTPPLLWSDILTDKVKFAFQAKGINGLVNSATLSQYFSAGGRLVNEQGLPKIDGAVLQTVLQIYQQALDKKVIDNALLEANLLEDVWPLYVDGQVNVAQVSVGQYLTNIITLSNTSFTRLPTQTSNDIPIAITRGWVVVLVTEDVNRQKIALNLLEWFLATNNNTNWNKTNYSIPTTTSAYQQISVDNPAYWQFLNEQLNTAIPQPSFSGYDQIGRILQQAVQEVLSGESTPEKAAAAAVDALTK